LTDSYRAGCKTLNLPGSIPAPQSSPRKATSAPRAPVTTPTDFPKVDNAQQKARDNDRREILNEELRMEEKKLAEARKEFNNGEPERQGNERNYAKYQERVEMMRDSISRIEKNIEALKREIANIK
jgi:transposase